MRKFVISSLISFLLIFFCVAFVSYYFYHQVVNGYIDKRIENTVYTSNLSTKDALESQIDYNINLLDTFYSLCETKELEVLNEKVKDLKLLNCNNIEFALLGNYELKLANKKYSVSEGFALSNFIYEKVSIINFSQAFASNNDGIYVMFILDEDIVAITKAKEFFTPIIEMEKEYTPVSFIINSNGYIYYQTGENKGNYFYSDYLTSVSSNSEKETLIKNINSGESGVSDSYYVNGKKCYLTYDELSVNGQSEKMYLVSAFYKEKLENFDESLTVPLMLTFVALGFILLLGTSIIYVVCLKKNDDIQTSKLSLYYCKPFIFRVNKEGKIIYKNSSFKKLDIDWNKYKTIFDFKDVHDDVLTNINKNKKFTIGLNTKDDKELVFDVSSLKVGLVNYLICDDITLKYEEINNALTKINYDEETNLLTKVSLENDLSKHLDMLYDSYQKKIVIDSSLVIFGIDSYNRYLDIFGLRLTNEIILTFLNLVKSTMDDDMVLYRLTKDVFGILFKKVSSYNDIIVWINNLNNLLDKPIEVDSNNLLLRTHFGVFNMELGQYDKITSALAIEYANVAYKRVKGLNVNDYMIYNIGLGKLIKREQLMEEDLKKAIENNEFVVYVQPQCDTLNRKIVGFEALTRWNNPKYINDSPQHFIELAEKNGLIIPIGKIITRQALEIAKALEKEEVTISINVSPAQLIQDGFVSQLIEMTEEIKVDPKMIALEVTETFLVENIKLMSEKLRVLKKFGFKIHLDDFGTGYSSMLYLKDLPIDAIKIDKEFIKYINTDKSSRVIVSKIISLATSLDMEIIAEGVEDEKQYQFLSKNGCGIVQGWLISKAVPFETAKDLLKEYNKKK